MNDPINPGEGWRILATREVKRFGDQAATLGSWIEIDSCECGTSVHSGTVRRRLEKTQEQKDNEALTEFLRIHGGGPPYSMTWFAALAYARKSESK